MRETLAEWRPAIDEAIADLVPREIDADYLKSTRFDPIALIQRRLESPFLSTSVTVFGSDGRP
ncbi:hypothetical protein Htur_1094 [Haloterrigena turkmenica DSM 5511]|uniref:Uncharacterized protein n=1 Tax=Haloterrigena turkmenica (strain ATCC 51198 / DSM 5511 / JCM 9101 / NCIMB 13204 / VKM B-1734 / 4k) TaxID=543526 RepID=D2RZ62_HALTV|nr:hypothetical protein Htur_1094 [Haloterrigena turkmenica DSM 5511]